jgi:holo-[acyl-carrier protein] synthase
MQLSNRISIGTDIVEISRFRSIQLGSAFFKRVFSEREMSYCLGYRDPAPHLAATFAAKEAVLKTVSHSHHMSEIEVIRDETGAPHVEWSGDPGYRVVVSMSHSSSVAVAVAVRCPSELPETQIPARVLDAVSRELTEDDVT